MSSMDACLLFCVVSAFALARTTQSFLRCGTISSQCLFVRCSWLVYNVWHKTGVCLPQLTGAGRLACFAGQRKGVAALDFLPFMLPCTRAAAER